MVSKNRNEIHPTWGPLLAHLSGRVSRTNADDDDDKLYLLLAAITSTYGEEEEEM